MPEEDMKPIVVTGASGFVGRALCRRLHADGKPVRAVARTLREDALPAGVEAMTVGNITGDTDWNGICRGAEVVVHLAARVHVQREASRDPRAEFRSVNVDGTLRLARQAAACGVRRFVQVSSIGVLGERSTTRPFSESDPANPKSEYARSKHEAEQGLWKLGGTTGMEIVVVRPPLVYGPGDPGNFCRLMKWVRSGIPLPLGNVHNRRSMVGLRNLVDFLVCCIVSPHAANETFHVSDGLDLSTTEWIRRAARAMGLPARLFSMPESLMRVSAGLLGHPDLATRLLDSFEIDTGKAKRVLGWAAPASIDQGMEETARWFLAEKTAGDRCGRTKRVP
jgi:nucleoside-diphosphate-sugar epimerase